MAGRSRNISVSEASRPVLPRHAKLKFDETRKVWVILAPERVLAPDEIAVENVGEQMRVDVPAAQHGADLLAGVTLRIVE